MCRSNVFPHPYGPAQNVPLPHRAALQERADFRSAARGRFSALAAGMKDSASKPMLITETVTIVSAHSFLPAIRLIPCACADGIHDLEQFARRCAIRA